VRADAKLYLVWQCNAYSNILVIDPAAVEIGPITLSLYRGSVEKPHRPPISGFILSSTQLNSALFHCEVKTYATQIKGKTA